MKTRLAIFAALLLSHLSSASAAVADDNRWYAGVAVGAADITDDEQLFFIHDSSWAYRFFGGYEVNDLFSLEVAYVDFEDVTEVAFFGTPDQRAVADGNGGNVAGIIQFPLTERFAVFGKAGYFFWNTETQFDDLSAKDDGSDLFLGFGLKFRLSDQVSLQLDYETFELENVNADVVTLGIRTSF